MSFAADIQIISVLDEILKYDVAGIPALLVNGKIICQKCIPEKAKLFKCLEKIIENYDATKNDLTLIT